MASANTIFHIAITLILLLKPCTVTSNLFSPISAPLLDKICNEVECGEGNCKPSLNSTFLFVCECEPGWIQACPKHNDYFKFLPCVIPSCTLDYDCAEIPSPVQEKEELPKNSPFDPCHWADCGGGICKRTSVFTHECECEEGYNNLLNITAFPCFKECVLGPDCTRLGIADRTFFPQNDSFIDRNGSTQANSALKDEIMKWWIIIVISVALIYTNRVCVVA